MLLLHGFPTSSHMFRNLIPALADHTTSSPRTTPASATARCPRRDEFEYTFDNLAEVIDAFTASVGLSATRCTSRTTARRSATGWRSSTPSGSRALVVQNGNAYDEGLREFWKPIKAYWKEPTGAKREALAKALEPEATSWQYTQGARRPERVSPDGWLTDQALLDRPGNTEIQLDLFYSYGSNPPLYPEWQAYFRKHQPPTLIVWGKNDPIFPAAGAEPTSAT